ncbi:MAG: DUF1003 domain-containing protein [Bacteroidota bacterium]
MKIRNSEDLRTKEKENLQIRNSNHVYNSLLKQSEVFAIWSTQRVGTIGFFFCIFLWTVCWLSWNMFAPKALRFDPFPAFVLWLFISNMIQIFLMPLIMVGQNLQGKHSEIRAENDYEINLKAEKEIAALQKDLTEIKSLLKQYLEKGA